MRFQILIVLIVLLLYRCTSENKEHKTKLIWTEVSNLMGDSNIMVELPNLVYCKSSIQKPCFGSAEHLILNCFSLIGNDSIYTEIESSIDFSFVKDKLYKIDSLFLEHLVSRKVNTLLRTTLDFKKIIFVNGRKLFVVKYFYKSKTCYKVHYFSERNYTSFDMVNISQVEYFDHILHSINIENRRYFMCF